MHGNNHAKKALVAEASELSNKAKELAEKLNNGSSEDTKMQSKALATLIDSQRLMIRMLEPLFLADLVTEEDCMAKQKEMGSGRIKIGPVEYQGKMSGMVIVSVCSVIPSIMVLLLFGKQNNWW